MKKCPRVVLAGLRGGSGKTVVTLGLIGALRNRGRPVSPFKKGPDYIDPQWITLAADRPCRNLDAFFMEKECILNSVVSHTKLEDIAVIEGNRGLYDGMDEAGTFSTAELAVMLDAPVMLVVDCTKTTRTIAAMVLGCKMMNPNVKLGGVILNQVARKRQEEVIRSAVEEVTSVPVVGAIPRIPDFGFEERHLGLYPPAEFPGADSLLADVTSRIEAAVDIESVIRIAESTGSLSDIPIIAEGKKPVEDAVRIGVFRDSAFHFYYPENLEALQRFGGEVVEISALRNSTLPEVDAVYIGGGFPESHAERLSANREFRNSLLHEIEKGLPVIAECGGLIYLGEALDIEERSYPMTGVFPVKFALSSRPQGHGYTVVETDVENPYFPKGSVLRGHEFRYAKVLQCHHDMKQTAFRVCRGYGFDGERDGLLYKNVVASFCHHHASGTDIWAEQLVRLAHSRRRERKRTVEVNSGTYG